MGTKYTIKQGDYLAKIAQKHGIADWKTIFHHPSNKALRERRKVPEQLAPGDKIYIPGKKEKEEDRTKHPRTTNSQHRFELPVKRPGLHLVLRNSDGTAVANTACKLTLEGKTVDASTNAKGELVYEKLNPSTTKATLEIGKRTLVLAIGDLDPVETLGGVQGRLRNLGFYNGTCKGDLDDPTREAVRSFKARHKLGKGVAITKAVTDKLRKEYGI